MAYSYVWKSNRSEYYTIIHYIIRWDTIQTDRTQRNAEQLNTISYITSLPTIPASTLLILSLNRRTADVHTIERNRLLITGVQGNFLSSQIFSKMFLSRSYHCQLFVPFESISDVNETKILCYGSSRYLSWLLSQSYFSMFLKSCTSVSQLNLLCYRVKRELFCS